MSITGRTTPDIAQQRIDGVAVMCPSGVLDAELADDLRDAALRARAPVVLDLTDCVLVEPVALLHLVADWELDRPELCIVCRRRSARELLRRARVDAHLPVFARFADAVAALGDGWSTDRSP